MTWDGRRRGGRVGYATSVDEWSKSATVAVLHLALEGYSLRSIAAPRFDVERKP
jgi:predicted acetyltransferase